MSPTFPPSTVRAGSICERCSKLDFTEVLEKPWTGVSNYDNNLGHLVATISQFSASCDLCNEFLSSVKNIQVFEGQPEDIGAYELRAFAPLSFPHGQLPSICSPIGIVWLQLIPLGHHFKEDDYYDIKLLTRCYGFTVCQFSPALQSPFHIQSMSPSFNAALARKWIQGCRKYHLEFCNVSVAVPDLVLIDCTTLELHLFSPPPRYAALSYVWAKTTRPVASNSAVTAPPYFLPQDTLSRTIKDAVFATKEVGLQYLWVDKYCVNQVDEAVRAHQINSMDLIYRGAELTLIAASGDDENYGLPGVSRERDIPKSFTTGGFIITHIENDRGYAICTSRWATRGWTFQEGLLSRRRLYFLPGLMCYVCCNMECCEYQGGIELCSTDEQVVQYSHSSLRVNSEPWPQLNRMRADGRGVANPLQEILLIIQAYTNLNLTFDADSIRAFAGIQRIFETQYHIGSIQGLPIPLAGRVSLEDLSTTISFQLSWVHYYPAEARRRVLFPTWTWAGWGGPCVQMWSESDRKRKSWLQDISFQYADGCDVPLMEVSRQLSAAIKWQESRRSNQRKSRVQSQDMAAPIRNFSSPTAICFLAPLAAAECFSFTDEHDWLTASYFNARIRLPAGSPEKRNQLPFTPTSFLNGLRGGILGCILLALGQVHLCGNSDAAIASDPMTPFNLFALYNGSPEYGIHLLLVQWIRPGEAHRIGKITMFDGLEKRPQAEEHIKSLGLASIKLW